MFYWCLTVFEYIELGKIIMKVCCDCKNYKSKQWEIFYERNKVKYKCLNIMYEIRKKIENNIRAYQKPVFIIIRSFLKFV